MELNHSDGKLQVNYGDRLVTPSELRRPSGYSSAWGETADCHGIQYTCQDTAHGAHSPEVL